MQKTCIHLKPRQFDISKTFSLNSNGHVWMEEAKGECQPTLITLYAHISFKFDMIFEEKVEQKVPHCPVY